MRAPQPEVPHAHLADAQGWLATFVVDEALRPDAAATVARLQASGVQTWLLSGYHEAAAQRMARALCSSSLVPREYQGQQGLANSLIALRLKALRPDLSVVMLEREARVLKAEQAEVAALGHGQDQRGSHVGGVHRLGFLKDEKAGGEGI